MATTLNYLITDLRLHLGDIDSTSYRYLDAWLVVALKMSVKTLQRWWDYKYLVDASDNVYRNSNWTFLFAEPPVIERGDERPIILMASLIIKEGSLESSSWNAGSWRDAEIAYSNIEGSKTRRDSLQKDWDELKGLLSPPTGRLATPKKGSLPGYKDNIYERTDIY
ncbi:hypothetical protein LCGC14_1573340 [marine sediment metagenome]|uniref:Uncharacterized protein n=1 Tax=marine sediment metagenome TaxID=412755 RepID=A0A0F9LJG4_9ZZZZ